MTLEIFFWYVLPYIIGAAGLGWILFDRWREKHRQHPGE